MCETVDSPELFSPSRSPEPEVQHYCVLRVGPLFEHRVLNFPAVFTAQLRPLSFKLDADDEPGTVVYDGLIRDKSQLSNCPYPLTIYISTEWLRALVSDRRTLLHSNFYKPTCTHSHIKFNLTLFRQQCLIGTWILRN